MADKTTRKNLPVSSHISYQQRNVVKSITLSGKTENFDIESEKGHVTITIKDIGVMGLLPETGNVNISLVDPDNNIYSIGVINQIYGESANVEVRQDADETETHITVLNEIRPVSENVTIQQSMDGAQTDISVTNSIEAMTDNVEIEQIADSSLTQISVFNNIVAGTDNVEVTQTDDGAETTISVNNTLTTNTNGITITNNANGETIIDAELPTIIAGDSIKVTKDNNVYTISLDNGEIEEIRAKLLNISEQINLLKDIKE